MKCIVVMGMHQCGTSTASQKRFLFIDDNLIKSLENEISAIKSEAREKDRRIRQIFHSLTWRTGNLILAPAKFVYNLFHHR